jgi:DNA-binding transcriptional LysR family regulator
MAESPLDQEALLRFLAVVEAWSFAAAARELGVSRQAVHRSVEQLENHAGAPLLDRGRRDQHPTPLGRSFIEAARAVRDAVRAVERLLTAASSEPTGLLRVTAPPLFGEAVVAPALAKLLARWPTVRCEARFVTGKTDLHRDDYDVMIRIGAAPDEDTYAVHLGRAGLALCAAPSLVGGTSPSEPDALLGWPVLGYGDVAATSWTLVRGATTVTVPVEPRLTSNSAKTMVEAALMGLGVLRAPMLAVAEALRVGALVRVLPDWEVPSADVWAVYGHRSETDPTLAAFIGCLREVDWE